MKRITIIILLVQLMFPLFAWDGTVAKSYAGGDGSAEHPFEIATAEQLALLAQHTNDGENGENVLHYVLTADIDLLCVREGDTLSWTPIGLGPSTYEDDRPIYGWRYFQGVFDGKGHTISNLYIRTDSCNVGLFGAVINSTFRNIRLVNADIASTGKRVGTLCGHLGYNSNVSHITTDNGKISGYAGVGGIIGCARAYYHVRYSEYIDDNLYIGAHATISHCVNGNNVSTNKERPTYIHNLGGDALGGICGSVSGYNNQGYIQFSHCDNHGTISGFYKYGGIVGEYFMTYGVSNVTMIEYCCNYGNIILLPSEYEDRDNTGAFAGICGTFSTSSGSMGTITACSNMTDIKCEYSLASSYSTGYCGGIVGLNQGTVTQCCNVGTISAYGWTGGICGYNMATITDCLNGGLCEYRATQGICGYNNATVLRCVNTNFANSSLSKVNKETMGNAHFDKQMCWINPTTSYRHFTKEMLGTKLQWALKDQWVYTDSLYPRPALLAETDEAYVAATPVYLEEYHYDPTGELPYDYTRNIQHCWAKLGQTDGLSWEISNPVINDTTYAFIQADSLFVHGSYEVIVKAKKGSAYRSIPLWFKNAQCKSEQRQDTTPIFPPVEEEKVNANFWYNGLLYIDITPEQMDSLVGGEIIEMDTLDILLPALPNKDGMITPALISYKESTPIFGIPLEQMDSITYAGYHDSRELFFFVPTNVNVAQKGVVGDCIGTTITLSPEPADKVVNGQWYVWENEQWVELPTNEVFATTQVEETEKIYQFRGNMMGENLIINGDFEQGATFFESDYQFVRDEPDNLGPEGTFTVTRDIGYVHGDSDCAMDHTFQNRMGKMLAVNGNTQDGVVAYRYRITQLTPNTEYALSTWASNWSYLAVGLKTFAQLKFCINGAQVGETFMPQLRCDWERFYTVWNSGDNTEALFTIQDILTESQGNDFTLDDIFFAPLTPFTYTIQVVPYVCPK